MIDYKLLKKLCEFNSISGDEKSVRNIIVSEIKPYADKITTDNLGNLIVLKKGTKQTDKTLMISAHMDEVGFMVTDITSDGYVKFDEVGGIDKRIVIGKSVTIGENNVCGAVGIKPIHLSKGDEATKIPPLSDMYIDIGAKSKEDALSYINYGDSINFDSPYLQTETSVMSKAIDDRFGCLVLIDMIKSGVEYDTYFTFVVQEEVGLRGSTVAAYSVNPDFAIVVETTTAADVPEIDNNKQVCNLGNGAVISFMDRRTIYDKELVKLAFDVAKTKNIKAQYKKAVAGGNDSGAIHKSRNGVRTLAISLACRYLHAPSCVADKDDMESVCALTKEMAKQILN